MVYACQKDSFLKEFTTTIKSCKEASLELTNDCGKKEPVSGFEVVTEDTILFPEGGGQPCDFGTLDNVPVVQVFRRGAEPVHFMKIPLEVGKSVKQTLDWDRRLDHMQHHSGQHLISAVAYDLYQLETTSWWLGEDIPHIEFNSPSVTQEQINTIEKTVNEKILDGIKITVDVYPQDDPILKTVRGKELPEDVVGGIRVVTIHGIESDMCCGTHVTNTSQLQVVKLLNAEKGKKGKTNLQFLVGVRVIKRMAALLQREKEITALLNNGPDWHVDLVAKTQANLKIANKNLQTLVRETAISDARSLKAQDPLPKYYSSHRKEADVDFINVFLKEFNDKSILLFLSVGDEKGQGQIVLHGDENLIKELGDEVATLLDGKGAGKGSKYSAKVKNMKNRSKAEKLIKEKLGI